MKTWTGRLPVALLCSVAASGSVGCGHQPTGSSIVKAANGLVSVSGINVMRDGVRWIPHGFYQIAFEVPPGNLAHVKDFWAAAHHGYTPAEYTQMLQLGADCVRLQVARTGIDPQGLYAWDPYRDSAIAAIKAARATGLTVIVSVQDEVQTGETTQLGLPGTATEVRRSLHLSPDVVLKR